MFLRFPAATSTTGPIAPVLDTWRANTFAPSPPRSSHDTSAPPASSIATEAYPYDEPVLTVTAFVNEPPESGEKAISTRALSPDAVYHATATFSPFAEIEAAFTGQASTFQLSGKTIFGEVHRPPSKRVTAISRMSSFVCAR